jgi:hypothetical protein
VSVRHARGKSAGDHGAPGTSDARDGKGSTVASRKQSSSGWPSAQYPKGQGAPLTALIGRRGAQLEPR